MKKLLQLLYAQTLLLITGILITPGVTLASDSQNVVWPVNPNLPMMLGIACIFLFLLLSYTFLINSQRKKLSRKLLAQKNEFLSLNDAPPARDFSNELNRANKKYNELLDTIQDGYIEIAINGVIITINSKITHIFNCGRDDLIGQHYTKLLSVTNNTEIKNVFKNIFTTGQPAQIKNVEIAGKDNVKRILEISASLMRDQNGKPEGFRGILRDVTKLTQAETNQNLLKAQLQRSQQIEAIGILAGGIAHDFNNLLMAIQGNISILLFNMKKDNLLYSKLINIETCVHSGAQLTKQLLGFSKGKKPSLSIVDINDLAEKASAKFKSTKKTIQIDKKLNPGIWNIEADSSQVQQVILNLFTNSLQTAPDNKLSIETNNCYIDSTSADRLKIKEGRYVQIIISNSDRNIDEMPAVDNIAEIKTRINAGIGITSSSEVVKSYDGLIEFRSFNSDETSYIVYLPISGGKRKKEIETVVAQENGTGTVLFVDDEEMIIEVGKPMLEELGYDVLVARGGKEAIKVYEINKGKIDLVILDMVMPEINAGDVYSVLKKINPKVKTLLSSGYSLNEQADKLIENGCNGFIQKPFNLKRLSGQIKDVLN